MVDELKESWEVLDIDELLTKCKCKLCGEVFMAFMADGLDKENLKLTWHPKTNQYCYMPCCPNGCEQIL